MRVRVCLATALSAVLVSSHAVGQTELTINDVMSQAEQRAIGVHTLTATQRDALNRWLVRYTLRVLDVAERANPGGPPRRQGSISSRLYAGGGGGHWINELSGDGAIVTLEDGSMWRSTRSTESTRVYGFPVSDITVLEADRPIAEYRYLLTNTEDGEKALAKYIGSR